jgi:prepilin-type processing-associated H-X9-DG protein
MTPLSDAQKQLLFDYSFGMTCEREAAEAEQLLSSSDEAAQLYDLLKSALSPLENVELEPCPDELAERTVLRLKEQARIARGQGQLDRLLAGEQARTLPLRVPFLRNWTEVAAMAAVLVLFMSVLLPAFGLARQKQWQSHCQSHFGGIYSGLADYVSDHDNQLPTVATAQGGPWWKVGTQGPESPSNTRRAWILVKDGYVPIDTFSCPARRDIAVPDLATLVVANFNDFPARSYIHFSVRIDGPQSSRPALGRKRVFLADLNPLSEQFPRDISASPSIELCDSLLKANSRNHRDRGQNILFCDGSVEFTKTRRTSVSDDDIYILRGMSCGCKVNGSERPASEDDTFVAP